MNIREIRATANMAGFGIPNPISGVLFGGEDQAHKFIISNQDGAAFSGTVSAKFLRYADNATVPLTGSIESGKATVTLIENCYNLPGRFKLTIYVTANGSTTAVYCCMGTVDRTDGQTTIDPSGEINLDVTDLINQINTATASIPADYSDLLAAIAPNYTDLTFPVEVGQYCWYDGDLYRCKTAIATAESWTAAHWEMAVVGDDITELKSALAEKLDAPSTAGTAGQALVTDGNGNVSWADVEIEVDATLSQSGEAADAKATGDEITELKSAIDDNLLDFVETVNPANWLNEDTLTDGVMNANGTTSSSDTKCYTDYIPVDYADSLLIYRMDSKTAIYRDHVTCYNADKEVMASSGTDSQGSGAFVIANRANAQSIKFVRITFSKPALSNKVQIVRDGTLPEAYSTYFEPYEQLSKDFLTPSSEETLTEVATKLPMLDTAALKGTNLVTAENSGVGAYYYSSGIQFDDTATSYKYAIVPLKKNTRYHVNVGCRYYIFTGDNGAIISYGNTGLKKEFFDSGNATKLYYTVAKNSFNTGLIIAEGYYGIIDNMTLPTYISGLNQLVNDSWFAVALPPRIIRFTVGINEKLYYKNILGLEKNILNLSVGGTKEDDGVQVTPTTPVSESNIYGYKVYDDNLSLVAQAPRGLRNRLSIYADDIEDCSALIIGDSIVARNSAKIGETMLGAFTEREKTLTLLGTLGTGDNKHEGRAGWSTSDYMSDKQYEGVTNPFYNPATETFDFGYYMENQEYDSVDFVIIHLGGNDLYSVDFDEARAKINQTEENICAMIDSILAWNENQKIIIELAPTISSNSTHVDQINQKFIRAKFNTYNAEALIILSQYANVRCSNDYMILDPASDLADHIHPTNDGLAKIGMELVSQINCWQQDLAT